MQIREKKLESLSQLHPPRLYNIQQTKPFTQKRLTASRYQKKHSPTHIQKNIHSLMVNTYLILMYRAPTTL